MTWRNTLVSAGAATSIASVAVGLGVAIHTRNGLAGLLAGGCVYTAGMLCLLAVVMVLGWRDSRSYRGRRRG